MHVMHIYICTCTQMYVNKCMSICNYIKDLLGLKRFHPKPPAGAPEWQGPTQRASTPRGGGLALAGEPADTTSGLRNLWRVAQWYLAGLLMLLGMTHKHRLNTCTLWLKEVPGCF